MPPSIREYREFLKQQESHGRPYEPLSDVSMGIIKTAAVSFDSLTNDPHWDRFLGQVQAARDEAYKQRSYWLSECGEAASSDGARKAQNFYHYFKGQVEALDAMIQLPNQVREMYSQVKQST